MCFIWPSLLFLNSIQHRWLFSGYGYLYRYHIYPDHSIPGPYQTYDYACSFHEEVIKITSRSKLFLISYRFKWVFLRHSRSTKVKVLYIVTRYAPFFLFAIHLYRTFHETCLRSRYQPACQWTSLKTKLLTLHLQFTGVNWSTTSALVFMTIHLE